MSDSQPEVGADIQDSFIWRSVCDSQVSIGGILNISGQVLGSDSARRAEGVHRWLSLSKPISCEAMLSAAEEELPLPADVHHVSSFCGLRLLACLLAIRAHSPDDLHKLELRVADARQSTSFGNSEETRIFSSFLPTPQTPNSKPLRPTPPPIHDAPAPRHRQNDWNRKHARPSLPKR